MPRHIRALTGFGPIGTWDVSRVTDMSHLFENPESLVLDFWNEFDESIDTWNVSNVTTMERMFYRARNFNNGGWPLTLWNTRSVRNMKQMFEGATHFNAEVGTWNVGR